MFNFFKNLYEPICLGNEYRKNKYGNNETIQSSFLKVKEMNRVYYSSLPKQTTKEKKLILSKASFWEQWTGSRFVKIQNPHFIEKQANYTAKSNPVTGDYVIIHF